MKDTKILIEDIILAFEGIESFLFGLDFDDFNSDDRTKSAVVRKFEIAGEAARNVPEIVRSKYPLVPWKNMVGMRDRLIHAYSGVDYRLIWRTAKESLPAILPLLKQIKKEI